MSSAQDPETPDLPASAPPGDDAAQPEPGVKQKRARADDKTRRRRAARKASSQGLSDLLVDEDTPPDAPRQPGRPGRPVGVYSQATRSQLTTMRRKTLVHDVMNLHSTTMRAIQLLIDRVAGIEARLAALTDAFADLPAEVRQVALAVSALHAGAPGPVPEENRMSTPHSVDYQDLSISSTDNQPPPQQQEPVPATERPLTFGETCCALYRDATTRPADARDEPALVKLFDRVALEYDGASTPEHLQEFLSVATRQLDLPRFWHVDDIAL